MKKRGILSKVTTIIFIIIICLILKSTYEIFETFYYGEFIKAEYNLGQSTFTRDDTVKYSDMNSYKIESNNFNDAMFYKEINVSPNTPYRISCMVKTENVVLQEDSALGGAQISIKDTVECSKAIIGTTDWTRLELKFNSKNSETVSIGFRLGGNDDNAKGTAWFSDFVLEEGIRDTDTNWNMALFILENINVNIDNKENVKLSMTSSDIYNLEQNIKRFASAANELSNSKMSVDYDIYEIKEELKNITYSEEFGYYVDPKDVINLIDSYVNKEEYDHIFIAVRLGDINQNIEIPVYDWIGLGGMDYYGIGFSNIRLPNDNKNYVYTYDTRINIFPEEVFIHEFLHTLERNLIEFGYDIPELHDNSKYGYEEKRLIGLKDWYEDYMNKNIKDENGNYIGLDPICYQLKPIQDTNFTFKREIEFNKEPENILEKILEVGNFVLYRYIQ